MMNNSQSAAFAQLIKQEERSRKRWEARHNSPSSEPPLEDAWIKPQAPPKPVEDPFAAQVLKTGRPIDDPYTLASAVNLDEFPTIRRKIVRRVELPVERKVRVPVKLLGSTPTNLEMTKEVEYVEYEQRPVIRNKEIWVKKVVPEMHIERVPVVKKKAVTVPAGEGVPYKVVPLSEANAFRIDQVCDKKVVEVEEWVEYKLQPVQVGKSIPTAVRELPDGVGGLTAAQEAAKFVSTEQKHKHYGPGGSRKIREKILGEARSLPRYEGHSIFSSDDPRLQEIKVIDTTIVGQAAKPRPQPESISVSLSNSTQHSHSILTTAPSKTGTRCRGGWLKNISQPLSGAAATSIFDSRAREGQARSKTLSKLGIATFGNSVLSPRPYDLKAPVVTNTSSKLPTVALDARFQGSQRSEALQLQLRAGVNLSGQSGVVIDQTPKENSLASMLGLARRDVITHINNQCIQDVQKFNHMLNASRGAVALTVWRGAQQMKVNIAAACFNRV